MTAYFDEKRVQIENARILELALIEQVLLNDCGFALMQSWIPEEIRTKAAEIVRRHAVFNRTGTENQNVVKYNEDHPYSTLEEIQNIERNEVLSLNEGLHGIFHAVGHLHLEQCGDDPKQAYFWYTSAFDAHVFGNDYEWSNDEK